MSNLMAQANNWLSSHGHLAPPLLLSVWIAWGDLKTRRIPNYLTLGGALAGLGFQLGLHGVPGLSTGLMGMALGFCFLFLPYLWGGLGAGDVKALAALGAWLGPRGIFYVFLYMGISGGLLALAVLWWRGLLWSKIRQAWVSLANRVLCGPGGVGSASRASQTEGIPYGVAMALGMLWFLWWGDNPCS